MAENNNPRSNADEITKLLLEIERKNESASKPAATAPVPKPVIQPIIEDKPAPAAPVPKPVIQPIIEDKPAPAAPAPKPVIQPIIEDKPAPAAPAPKHTTKSAEHKPSAEPNKSDSSFDIKPKEQKSSRGFGSFFRSNLIRSTDNGGEVVRKLIFWFALIVLVISLCVVLYQVWLLPEINRSRYNKIEETFYDNPDDSSVFADGGKYPAGMLTRFKSLYDENPEVRGWISFHATSKNDFLNIEYPIVYSGDNEKYLKTDFFGNNNKNGALFFDERTEITANKNSKVLIVYGHNMASGQMFAGLNKFIGPAYNARAAYRIYLDTLYERRTYLVFAAILTDENAENKYYFNSRQTDFASDEDFLRYIDEVKTRSMFHYPLEIGADDEILVLSTCTAPSSAKIDNGRLVVYAVKASQEVIEPFNATGIIKNDDALMPYNWYVSQDMKIPSYYSGGAQSVISTKSKSTAISATTVAKKTDVITTTAQTTIAAKKTTVKATKAVVAKKTVKPIAKTTAKPIAKTTAKKTAAPTLKPTQRPTAAPTVAEESEE